MTPFEDLQNSTTEVAALFKATRAVLEHIEFKDAALAVFNAAKDLVGATAGYVALLSKDRTKNELLFLDSGGVPCRVDPLLPMPTRGLREKAYSTSMAVYDNAFKDSEWVKFLPEGHAPLDNVLFAPLLLEGKAAGLIGLANKPGGFNEHDARMLSAFGDIAAIALSKNRVLEALQESEERFRALVENAPEAFYVISAEGIITSLNPAFEDITGWPRDEWLGRHFSDIIHPDDIPVAKKWFQHVLRGNKTPLHELRVLSKSGGYIIAEFISAPFIKNGEIAGVSGITRNITERKRMEDALLDSEEKYRRLFENTSNGIVIFDSETLRFEDVNTACLNLYGYTKEEFLSLSPLDVSAEVEKSRISLQKGLDSEVTHIPLRYHKKKDGTVFPVEIFAGAFFHKGRKKGIGVIVDLTERMQAEEELRLAYKELKEKSENLERFHRITVGRELKMVELKKEVNELLEKLGQSKKYEAPDEV